MRGRHIAARLVFAAVMGLSFSGACATSEGDSTAQSESARVGWKGSGSSDRDAMVVADGHRIAQRECASCHSIDQSSVSPNSSAPAFRDFVFLNDPDWVGYRLIEGMRLGHDSMPLFDFDVRSADALMAYISTLDD